MNWWIPLLAGLAIGWLVELIMDYVYWRSKRICTGAEERLKSALDDAEVSHAKLQGEMERLSASEATLRSTLEATEASHAKLQDEVERLSASEATLRSTLVATESSHTKLQGEVERLSASAERTEFLQTELASKETELAHFQSRLRDRDADLIHLRQQERLFREQEKKVRDVDVLLQRQEREIEQLTSELNELMKRNAHAEDLENRLLRKEEEVDNLMRLLLAYTQNPMPVTNGMAHHDTHQGGAPSVVPNRSPAQSTQTPRPERPASRSPRPERPTSQVGFALEADRDQLQLIWGIDDKNAEVLHRYKIFTFSQLAAVGPSRLRDIVQTSGLQVNPSDTVYWSMQAHLAAAGAWDEFTALKNKLRLNNGGRVDDLQVIRGIGPTINGILVAHGISTFEQLATAEVGQLDAILQQLGVECGFSSHDLHKSWTEQARLAARSEWEQLARFQTQIDWWEKLETFSS